MSVPTNLFVDSPESQDLSMSPLSEDVNTWSEEVMNKFRERLPNASSLHTSVKFMKVDEETGYATGSIVVSDDKKGCVIPIIVKDFSMFPLDIFIAEGKILPLTTSTFDMYFQNNSPMGALAEYPAFGGVTRFDEGNLWSATYPPSLGRYAYAADSYPILSEIESSIDGKLLRDALLTDTRTAVKYAEYHSDMIKKIANHQPVNQNEFMQGAEKLMRRTIHMLKAEGGDKYTILSNADDVWSPAITRGAKRSDLEFKSVISGRPQDDINDVDNNGEKILRSDSPIADGELYIASGIENDPTVENCDSFDTYELIKKNGVHVVGMVIPTVIDFDMSVKDLKVFVGKGSSAIQQNFAGKRLKNPTFNMLPTQEPKVGQTGVFVYFKEGKAAVCTLPVTIAKIHSWISDCATVSSDRDCADLKIQAKDMLGLPVNICWLCSKDESYLHRIATVNGIHRVPASMKWVALEGFENFSENISDFIAKTASMKKIGKKLHIQKLTGDAYNTTKIAGVTDSLGDGFTMKGHEVKFMLASMGASNEAIEGIIKKASHRDGVQVYGLRWPTTVAEKVATLEKRASGISKIAKELRRDLTKQAADIMDSHTVDAMLSLNFINPENIGKFIGKIPVLKSAASSLANLLLASRLGLQEVNQESAALGMTKVLEVINGLESIRASQEQGLQEQQ